VLINSPNMIAQPRGDQKSACALFPPVASPVAIGRIPKIVVMDVRRIGRILSRQACLIASAFVLPFARNWLV